MTMKIRVQHRDGRIETLNLRGPVELVEGDPLHHIADQGLDHYFTREGFYDGWGAAVNCDEQTAMATIEAMEQKREIQG